MTVSELSNDQMLELKQDYLTQHLLEVEERTPSYGELADADNIVDDAIIFEQYDGVVFSEDDFACSAK